VASRLASRGHEVHVYCARAGAADERQVRVRETLHDYVAPRPPGLFDARLALQWFDPHNYRALARVLGSSDYDVGFVWNMACTSFASLTAFAQSPLPLAWEVSDLWLRAALGGPKAMGAPPDPRRELMRQPLSLVPRMLLPRRAGDRWIFVSDWLRRDHAGLLGESEIVIPHGVEIGGYQVPERPLGGPPARVLYAGRLHPTKGAHFFLRALAATRGPMTVTIAGDGDKDYVAALEEAAARAARPGLRIEFVGRVSGDRMPALYRDHDVYVLPTLIDEAFSVGLLEAMATGMASVVSRTGGSPEIARDGDNALLVGADDTAGLAGALDHLARDPALRARMGAAARKTIEGAYQIEPLIDRTEAVLVEAARRPGL
jgi:glycosyltransferase involved in cell wall biosynthesis